MVDVIFAILTTTETRPGPRSPPAQGAGNTAPVVIVSRNLAVEAAVEAMREGAADYLREPCTIDALRGALRRLEPPPDAQTTAVPAHDDAPRHAQISKA